MAPTGLTKREYFAAMAMQGLLMHGPYAGEPSEILLPRSVYYADALLKELENKKL